MEILDPKLKEKFKNEPEVVTLNTNQVLEQRHIEREEMSKIIMEFISILKEVNINGTPLITNTFNNDTIIIDPQLKIEIINKVLNLNESSLFNFIYNIYFYNLNKILEKCFGNYIFLNVPALSFLQTGENRFQFDF